jgi:hypothetical protein
MALVKSLIKKRRITMLGKLRFATILLTILLTVPLVLGLAITAEATDWKTPPGPGEHWKGPALICDLEAIWTASAPGSNIGDVEVTFTPEQYMNEDLPSAVQVFNNISRDDFDNYSAETIRDWRLDPLVVSQFWLVGTIGVNTVISFERTIDGTIRAKVVMLYIEAR